MYWGEIFYGFFIGVGFGVFLLVVFIVFILGFELSQVVVVIFGFYFSMNIGSLLGVSIVFFFIVFFVESILRDKLFDLLDKEQIIRDVFFNFDVIDGLLEKIVDIVFKVYERSFVNIWCKCFCF